MGDIYRGGVVILDFGSQYTQLIARRIREQNVFSFILPSSTSLSDIQSKQPKALILSGGPSSVFEDHPPLYDNDIFHLDIPILGICYGLQLMVNKYGGKIDPGIKGEYGFADIRLINSNTLFMGVENNSRAWMSHMDKVTKVPEDWIVLAESSNEIIAAMSSPDGKRYATQFHPEVAHTDFGDQIIENFLFHISNCERNWTPGNFINDQIQKIRNNVGDRRVICGVSGGVDSSVVSALMQKAIGDRCHSVLIDHGLLRKNEAARCVSELKKGLNINIQSFDKSQIFLKRLQGIVDPEEKRKIIGEQFIRSFENIAKGFNDIEFFSSGNIIS